MTRWFTADLHFGHTNIMEFTQRPYRSIEEHDRDLVRQWNSVVNWDDIVYVLGDFTGPKRVKKGRLRNLYNSLRGAKVLVAGNHDHGDVLSLPWLTTVHRRTTIEMAGLKFGLSHTPDSRHLFPDAPEFVLHGHLHSSEARMPCYDVGLDAHDLQLVRDADIVNAARRYIDAFDTLAAMGRRA